MTHMLAVVALEQCRPVAEDVGHEADDPAQHTDERTGIIRIRRQLAIAPPSEFTGSPARPNASRRCSVRDAPNIEMPELAVAAEYRACNVGVEDHAELCR